MTDNKIEPQSTQQQTAQKPRWEAPKMDIIPITDAEHLVAASPDGTSGS